MVSIEKRALNISDLRELARRRLATGMPRFKKFPSVLQRSLTEAAPKGNKAGLPKNDSITWADFDDLRRIWRGPLIVKGILHPDDADIAVWHGADAIIVSNHGGRNLDASIAPFLALPEIVDRVGAPVSVLVDGGILRGSDVAKALAMGASAVLVGRSSRRHGRRSAGTRYLGRRNNACNRPAWMCARRRTRQASFVEGFTIRSINRRISRKGLLPANFRDGPRKQSLHAADPRYKITRATSLLIQGDKVCPSPFAPLARTLRPRWKILT